MENTNLKSRLNTKVQTIQEAEQSQQLALVENASPSGYLALNDSTMELIRENLPDQSLNYQLFDVVKSPSGGSTVFTVPGLSGDEAEKELTGIVLGYTTPRAYWDTPDPVEGTPPTCFSHNSLVSESGKVCAHCPFNDYGSKDGETGAKACKESVLLFLLRPGNVLPLLVRVPVTSKGLFLRYTARLTSALTPLNGVVTRISLKKATSRGGKPYALFHFEAVSALSPEEAASAKAFARQFMEAVKASEAIPKLEAAG
ncbi:hypothetical protein [Faecalibacterium sp. An77]|uniref:hypothetical protein n=1 Tax=Faecalibacterium sp. An77 TaxID=1965655 RepID=UPI0011868B08|nr:hypothetical protein [Faecalibacterium sp. An77]